ncbi:hypothetical protein CC117_12980 [Parafrankia colletiae]|uniref:Uncharacterized protein n=1 Tax=Parafrankia colletiae TaxID=573497 RepID=A0A1S1R5E2_9ACTN|nr:hypothetical protein [Frankia sp. Cpl3]OHV41117.1 hypothetical protein CC117_12980 [Parafrankia colletiae]
MKTCAACGWAVCGWAARGSVVGAARSARMTACGSDCRVVRLVVATRWSEPPVANAPDTMIAPAVRVSATSPATSRPRLPLLRRGNGAPAGAWSAVAGTAGAAAAGAVSAGGTVPAVG